MSDDPNLSEPTDADKLPPEYPPEEPRGVDDYGVTAAEQGIDEPLAERVRREAPEAGRPGADNADPDRRDPDRPDTLVEPEAGALPDVTAEAVAAEVDERDADQPAAQQHPEAAEEAAVQVTEPPPLGDDDGYLDQG